MGANISRDRFGEAERELFRARLRAGLDALAAVLRRPGFGPAGERSIGVELELFLIDEHGRAKSIGQDVARMANSENITPEIGRFDIEFCTAPVALSGRPFSLLRDQMRTASAQIAEQAAKVAARAVPISILPTLRREDFGPQTITDLPRYRALAHGMQAARRAPFEICINGDDPLRMTTDDVAMESANTGFQIHLKVAPGEFARFFNAAQMMTGAVMAAAGNSPTFLGHRLWHETRTALFKQAGDDRPSDAGKGFRLPARIGFGSGWVREGAFELFAESVALHEPLLAECGDEDPALAIREGRVPKLWELRLHHGTVWKWNRPVYDPVAGGHLRIEMRALPSGPSTEDMLANAAFLIGGVLALAPNVSDLLPGFPFALAERNFYRAAQYGLNAEMAWPTSKNCAPRALPARELLQSLIPLAAKGLREAGVQSDEVDLLLGIFQQRVHSGTTGAVWQRSIYEALIARGVPRAEALAGLLERYLKNVESGQPVGAWSRELSGSAESDELKFREAVLPGGANL
jgi:gamma-glutamyl:cysteine ligase YbdK (ATP-grasp superfamily)